MTRTQRKKTEQQLSAETVRGGRLQTLPRIPSSKPTTPSNARMPDLPLLENDHPMPFFVTGDVVFDKLPHGPYVEPGRQKMQQLVDSMELDDDLQDQVVNDVLNDALREEMVTVVNIAMQEQKKQAEKDRQLLQMLDEGIIKEVSMEAGRETAWEMMLETSRRLSPEHIEELRENELSPLEPNLYAALLRFTETGVWKEDQKDEKMRLSGLPWKTLLLHVHKIQGQRLLSQNVALFGAQEKIAGQAMEGKLQNELTDTMKSEMIEIDENEKLKLPPRQA